jgi:hypothetical protein
MKMKTNLPAKRKNVHAEKTTILDQWLTACRQACRCGIKSVPLEGFRLQINAEHQKLFGEFMNEDWIGWPVGKTCIRIAPDFAIGQFLEDRASALKNMGPLAVSVIGECPVEVRVRRRGRISLPAHLTLPTDINKKDKIIMVPRLGFLEIYKLEIWDALCQRQTASILSQSIGNPVSSQSSSTSARVLPPAGVDAARSQMIRFQSK